MRIIEVLNSYPGETFIGEHAKAISQNCTDIDLFGAFTQTNTFGEIASANTGYKKCLAVPNFDRLPLFKKGFLAAFHPFSSFSDTRKKAALEAFKRMKPDLVHFHFAASAIKWGWVAEDLGIPFTFSVRGSDVQVAPFNIKGYVNELVETAKKAKGIHAVCDDLGKQFVHVTQLDKIKIDVIRTCISTDWDFANKKESRSRLVSIGRLHWRKGFPDLILALSILRTQGNEFQLSLGGSGPKEKELRFMVKDLGLEEHVNFLGQLDRKGIKEAFSRSDIYVCPSLQEGFPNVLGEAMASGLPIVSTNCDCIPEVVKDEQNGFLAKTGSPEDLAKAILRAHNSSHKFEQMRKDNYDLAQYLFSQKNHARSFEKFWVEVRHG